MGTNDKKHSSYFTLCANYCVKSKLSQETPRHVKVLCKRPMMFCLLGLYV